MARRTYRGLWDFFDFLDVVVELCVGHTAAVFGKIGQGVSNFSKERLYRCGKSVHLAGAFCVLGRLPCWVSFSFELLE